MFGITFPRTAAQQAALRSAQADFPLDISLTGAPLAYLPQVQATTVQGLTSAEWHQREAARYAAFLAHESEARVQTAFRATPLRSRLAAQYALAVSGTRDVGFFLERMS